MGRREKLFQKCPVTPAEEGVTALFMLSGDAGGAAFPLPVTYKLLRCLGRAAQHVTVWTQVRWYSALIMC